MANYDWTEYRGRSWENRYPDGVRGLDAWRQQVFQGGAPSRLIEERGRSAMRLPKPCLFVSHRQTDDEEAKRIAYLACQEGFDYWLDVLDPTLTAPAFNSVPGASTPSQTAAAIAAIVEMALLNSTHVMAVMTVNTKGSQWVPYEYGRVRDPVPITLRLHAGSTNRSWPQQCRNTYTSGPSRDRRARSNCGYKRSGSGTVCTSRRDQGRGIGQYRGRFELRLLKAQCLDTNSLSKNNSKV